MFTDLHNILLAGPANPSQMRFVGKHGRAAPPLLHGFSAPRLYHAIWHDMTEGAVRPCFTVGMGTNMILEPITRLRER